MNYIEKERNIVKKTITPNTIKSLMSDFKALGLIVGDTLLVHASLSQLGWTVGGPVSVIDALLTIIGKKGTLVMPTFSAGNTDPQEWQYPPVPNAWHSIIRENMPAFHVDKTPTRGMGTIAETFRKYPGVIRSNHPVSSFSARGKHAKFITRNHKLDSDLGEGSPLARIYDLNGKVLLLGVTHSSNSSIHLAEYRSEYKEKYCKPQGSSIFVDGRRRWVEWKELNIITDDFEDIGKDYEAESNKTPKKVGLANALLFDQRELVDFAVEWIKQNRNQK
ncbi:MAG: AAC(3) family N-acetyltransferase [Promethearchaeota archaeon]|nr:MAG: AAC(3) family N-acetyltransferase [Candidatus Lokiarchaeota archaeon]